MRFLAVLFALIPCAAWAFGTPIPAPIFDQLAGGVPAVGYSVRVDELAFNQASLALVRRSSDNVQRYIYEQPNGVLDQYDLAAFCAGTNAYLVVWKDQGFLGSAADESQSTAAPQPQVCAAGVVETGPNGLPAILLTTSTSINSPNILNASNFTFTALFAFQTISGANNIFGDPYQNVHLAGNAFWFDSTYNYFTGFTFATNKNIIFKVARIASAASASKIYINGTNYNSGFTAASNNTNGIGWLGGSSANLASELIGWTNIQSASDQATYDLNAASFFGIAGVTQ